MSMGTPMARYAAARRVGDFVFMSGVVAMDPATRRAVSRYEDLPESAQADLRRVGDYAHFNRVRGLFYPDAPPVSTVVEVNRFLPGDEVLIEVEATMHLPPRARA